MKASLNDKFSTAKEKITAFLTQQEITLNAEEERMLARWEAADRLLQQKLPLPQIVERLTNEFSISRFTAQNDVFTAQEIFGAARKLDKRYLLFMKYQRQEADIERIRKKMFKLGENGESNNDEWGIDAKELQALAKLEEAITYTLNSIPQEAPAPIVKQPVMLFNTVNNYSAPMSVNDALAEADRIININDSDVQP